MKKRVSVCITMACVLVVWGFLGVSGVVAADKYPSKPVTSIVTFGPGGVSDLTIRLWNKYLEKYVGGTFVVDHKPGGGGVIGFTYVANAKPDGYTFLNSADYYPPVLNGTATYKMEDLRVVAQVVLNGCVLAVSPDAPWKNFREFAEYAKKNPGVKWGHQGVGTLIYFRTENLNRQAGLKLIGVPMKGDAEIISGLLGKHITIGSLSAASAKAQAEAGKLRILLSFDPPKGFGLDPSINDMATIYPNVPDIEVGIYLVAPAKTPKEYTDIIEKGLEKASKDPEFIKEAQALNQMVSFLPGKAVMDRMPKKMALVKEIMQDTGMIK
jgi:tripartite-type tricarboxylate transporter receptor subunit TctC